MVSGPPRRTEFSSCCLHTTPKEEGTMIIKLLFCASLILPLNDQAAEKKSDEIELLPIEANVISYTNTEREKRGLAPLELDKELMESARDHCSWMTRNRIFTHTRRAVAENIAMGQANSSQAVRAWMNSSGHRANILNPNHRRIGVGAFRTESGTIYWCQQFRR